MLSNGGLGSRLFSRVMQWPAQTSAGTLTLCLMIRVAASRHIPIRNGCASAAWQASPIVQGTAGGLQGASWWVGWHKPGRKGRHPGFGPERRKSHSLRNGSSYPAQATGLPEMGDGCFHRTFAGSSGRFALLGGRSMASSRAGSCCYRGWLLFAPTGTSLAPSL
jgi:hypothetical protein